MVVRRGAGSAGCRSSAGLGSGTSHCTGFYGLVVLAPLLVVTGPPGAGKTTVARRLAEQAELPSVHLHADDFWHHLVQGYIQPWLEEAHQQNQAVMRAVLASAISFWQDGYQVVLDGVLGPWFLPALWEATPRDMEIDYVVLRPTLSDALERVQTRQGHGFRDDAATRHMYAQFQDLPEPYEGHVVDTSSLSAESATALIRSQQGQSLRLARSSR